MTITYYDKSYVNVLSVSLKTCGIFHLIVLVYSWPWTSVTVECRTVGGVGALYSTRTAKEVCEQRGPNQGLSSSASAPAWKRKKKQLQHSRLPTQTVSSRLRGCRVSCRAALGIPRQQGGAAMEQPAGWGWGRNYNASLKKPTGCWMPSLHY